MENNEESALYSKEKHLITQETRDYIYSTISGFISLCKLRLGKGHGIKPGFINSDIVENLFGQHRGIRNGLNDNPTLSQYGPSNTAIILGQCSVSSKCNSGKTTAFYSATTPCALNTTRNKCNKKKRRTLRIWKRRISCHVQIEGMKTFVYLLTKEVIQPGVVCVRTHLDV